VLRRSNSIGGRQQTGVFEDVSAYAFNMANLTGESVPEQIPTMQVSAGFFRLCGASAVSGRAFPRPRTICRMRPRR